MSFDDSTAGIYGCGLSSRKTIPFSFASSSWTSLAISLFSGALVSGGFGLSCGFAFLGSTASGLAGAAGAGSFFWS